MAGCGKRDPGIPQGEQIFSERGYVMPTTYAHYRFGTEVLSALPRSTEQIIEANRELFDLGLHGPDILFYYGAPFPNRISAYGLHMHKKDAYDFFRSGKDVISRAEDPAAASAYMYGFICHFVLDSECHPYIEKMIHTGGISHSEIEMELDRFLMTADRIPAARYLRTKHICPSKKNAHVIAPFFEGISEAQVKRALAGMILCHRVLRAPGKIKRSVLFGGMRMTGLYQSYHGLVVGETADLRCTEYCRLLKKLYAGAVPLAADLIMKYQRVLLQNGELPQRFHQTFGPGDTWEELAL